MHEKAFVAVVEEAEGQVRNYVRVFRGEQVYQMKKGFMESVILPGLMDLFPPRTSCPNCIPMRPASPRTRAQRS